MERPNKVVGTKETKGLKQDTGADPGFQVRGVYLK